jgi:hypothetical protein
LTQSPRGHVAGDAEKDFADAAAFVFGEKDSGAQDQKRTNDAIATTAEVVVFWPAAFFVGGDRETAAELAQMKGQMVAIEQASIQKKCGIQFQGPRPPGT